MRGAAELPLKRQEQLQDSSVHYGTSEDQLFPVGSLVEIRTDEEDYEGVYFVATVLPSFPLSKKKNSKKNSDKLHVEYRNLLAEDGLDLLREEVDISFIRPAPPPQEDVEIFELEDSVDAFYKDGWWVGVITRVLEGGRFIVTFQNPPDELEFGASELRVHWDWHNGRWSRPEKQGITTLMFDIGRKVEVSFDLEDFLGAWFPTTIHKVLKNGTYLVEYRSSNISNEDQFLKATVDSLHIRPCPPLLKDKNYILLEQVDSYFNFGWWNGVITKVLEDCRYNVTFKQTNKEKEFHQSELRPHMDWKDSKWFTSSSSSFSHSCKDIYLQSSVVEKLSHQASENIGSNTLAVPVGGLGDNSCDWRTRCLMNLRENQIEPLIGCSDKVSHKKLLNQIEPIVATNEQSSHAAKSFTKRRWPLSEAHSRLLQPLKKLKEVNIAQVYEQAASDISGEEFLNGSMNNMQPTTVGQSTDNLSPRTKNLRTPRKYHKKDYSISITLKKSRTTLQVENPEPGSEVKSLGTDFAGKDQDAGGNAAENVLIEHAGKEIEFPIIIGLPCAEMNNSRFGVSAGKRDGCHHHSSKEIVRITSNQEQDSNGSAVGDTKNTKQTETGESTQKRKRGRPRRELVNSLVVTGNAKDGNVGSDCIVRKDSAPHVDNEIVMTDENSGFNVIHDELTVGSDSKIRIKNAKGASAKMREEQSMKELTAPRKSPSKRGSILTVEDSTDLSVGKKETESNCFTEALEKAVDVVPCYEVEEPSKWIEEMQSPTIKDCLAEALEKDVHRETCSELHEPLSKWIEGMQTPSIKDSGVSPVSTLEECVETIDNRVPVDVSEKQKKCGLQPCAFDDTDVTVSNEEEDLPFTKKTVLWKAIESMEIFQRIPQRPHFRPLVHFKESSREGLAVGYMVTFSRVVEKASVLQISDPKSITDEILETLAELEKYGFDVGVVEDHVTQMLKVKHKREKLTEETKEIGTQISYHNIERLNIDEEIHEMRRQILKLEEKISMAASDKEKKDSKIASLQSMLQVVEEDVKIMEREFENLASSLYAVTLNG